METNTIKIGNILHHDAKTPLEVKIHPHVLTKHAAIMGASGSGKTGVVLGVAEEMVRNGVPIIILDIKGDMINLAMQNDPELRNKMHVRLITPGAEHGTPVNLFAGLGKPDRVTNSVSALLKTIGESPDPLTSHKHTYLSKIVEHCNNNGIEVTLEQLIEYVKDPPFENFGSLIVEEAVPRKVRAALAAKINNLLVAPSFQTWLTGDALDVEELYKIRDDGKVNVTIYSVAHIHDEDSRQFAIALLFDEVLGWMRAQSGSSKLRASLIIDECKGITPPHPYNPPSKRPIMLLVSQARAVGLGIIFSTQNTKDIDYKVLGNCETFIIGRLFMKRDRQTVVEGVSAQCGTDPAIIEYQLSRLKAREFIIARPGLTTTLLSRDVTCQLVGPLVPREMVGIAD